MYKKFKIIAILCLVLILVHVANHLLGGQLSAFGIAPRNIRSLPYILSTPFIHGNLAHLINNLFGLCIFSALCLLLKGHRFYMQSSLFIVIFGGTLVWIFGRPAIHIGASGWIFGLWGLTVALAWFERSATNIIIAVFVLFFYGGMIYGVLPGDRGVSFESHFFGLLAGVVWAWYGTRGKKV